MHKVSDEKLDLLVFLENCYTPFPKCYVNVDINTNEGYLKVKNACMDLSKKIGCPVIYGGSDNNGIIYSMYVNPFATLKETVDSFYYKHTATDLSAFDLNYQERVKNNFPI